MTNSDTNSPTNKKQFDGFKQQSVAQKILKRAKGILASPFTQYKPKKRVQLKDFSSKNKEKGTPQEIQQPSYIKRQISNLRTYSQTQIDAMVKQGQSIIVLEDLVYDVTKWKNVHPGGSDIIKVYEGVDATEQFFAFHRPRVAKRLESFLLGKVEVSRELSNTEYQYKKMRNYLWENNYFTSCDNYYNKKYMCLIILFLVSIFLAYNQNYILAAILLGQFIKQSAYIAHDSFHYCINPQKPGQKLNLHGMFFGCTIFGISGDMWNDEHTMHHAITRRPMEDPQFNYLPVWLISEKELTWKKFKLDFLSRFLIRIQHFTFIPLAMVVGRFNLYIISIVSVFKTGQFLNLLGMALYWAWYIPFVNLIEGSTEKFIFVLLNHSIVGILHVQLLINHLAVDAFTEEEERNMDFFTFQLKTTRNIITQWWNTWFHGGLSMQIEHHLFPQLPRHNLGLVTPAIKEICNENKIEFRERGFWNTLYICTNSFRDLAYLLIKGELG